MSDLQSEHEKFVKDSRIPCKYGLKCYQQNPGHHEKYKHPPAKGKPFRAKHVAKKLKVETDKKVVKEVVTKNDVSDSDDYNIEDDSDQESNRSDNSDDEKSSENESDSDSSKKEDKNREKISNDVSDSDSHGADLDKTDLESDTEKKEDPKEIQKHAETSKQNSETIPKNEENETNHREKLNHKEFIKEKFLVDMPEDFYQFWTFCKGLKSSQPQDALKDIGLYLVGPYDVLAGKFDKVDKPKEEYLIHWRYYHDPPEFQTVLKGDVKTGYHIGYFRDSPEESPVFLASNHSKKDGILCQMGGNIFAAVNLYLEELKKSGDPFRRMHIGKIQTAIKSEAEKLKIDLSRRTDAMVSREKKIVSRTFNKIGLVVPYDRKSQLGWRELALGGKEIRSLFTKLQNALPEQKSKYLSELQPVFTYASIAADECDFGTGIELGWDIISHGVDSLNQTALNFLASNYRLLNREAFAKIAEAHMKNRKKGCDLSII